MKRYYRGPLGGLGNSGVDTLAIKSPTAVTPKKDAAGKCGMAKYFDAKTKKCADATKEKSNAELKKDKKAKQVKKPKKK